jgi:hypothetical protein
MEMVSTEEYFQEIAKIVGKIFKNENTQNFFENEKLESFLVSNYGEKFLKKIESHLDNQLKNKINLYEIISEQDLILEAFEIEIKNSFIRFLIFNFIKFKLFLSNNFGKRKEYLTKIPEIYKKALEISKKIEKVETIEPEKISDIIEPDKTIESAEPETEKPTGSNKPEEKIPNETEEKTSDSTSPLKTSDSETIKSHEIEPEKTSDAIEPDKTIESTDPKTEKPFRPILTERKPFGDDDSLNEAMENFRKKDKKRSHEYQFSQAYEETNKTRKRKSKKEEEKEPFAFQHLLEQEPIEENEIGQPNLHPLREYSTASGNYNQIMSFSTSVSDSPNRKKIKKIKPYSRATKASFFKGKAAQTHRFKQRMEPLFEETDKEIKVCRSTTIEDIYNLLSQICHNEIKNMPILKQMLKNKLNNPLTSREEAQRLANEINGALAKSSRKATILQFLSTSDQEIGKQFAVGGSSEYYNERPIILNIKVKKGVSVIDHRKQKILEQNMEGELIIKPQNYITITNCHVREQVSPTGIVIYRLEFDAAIESKTKDISHPEPSK